MHQYGRAFIHPNDKTHFHPNPWNDASPYLTPFENFVRNGTFSRNISQQPSKIIIQSCIVCHLPIQANWMTTNIQVHGHCFQHVYREAVQLQIENIRLGNEVTVLRDQVENLKMQSRIKEFYEENRPVSESVKSSAMINGGTYGNIRPTHPTDHDQIPVSPSNTNGGSKDHENRTITYKVTVGNMPEAELGTTRSVLKKSFSKFGTINKIWINPVNKLYGFVEYEQKHSAENAAQGMNGQKFLGKALEVEIPFSSSNATNNPAKSGSSQNADAEHISVGTSTGDLGTFGRVIVLDQKNPDSKNKESKPKHLHEKECQEEIINEQEKKILSLKLIVNSQKQVIMKYRNSLKNYEDSDYGTMTSTISLTRSSLTGSKEKVLKDISNETKENISLIRETKMRC